MVRPPELTPQTQPQRGFTELFRLIRSLPSQSPDKSGVMGELCRLIRHLGSGIVWKALMRETPPIHDQNTLLAVYHACYWKQALIMDAVPEWGESEVLGGALTA